MKRAFFIALGCVWIGFGLLLLLFTVQFLSGGVGVQTMPNVWIFGLLNTTTFTLGWVHVMGLLIASLICCCVGVALWAYTPLSIERNGVLIFDSSATEDIER